MTSHTLCTYSLSFVSLPVQRTCSSSCTDKRGCAVVMQTRHMVADDKLHYGISFVVVSAGIVLCCTCTSPTLYWHCRHYSCTSASFAKRFAKKATFGLFCKSPQHPLVTGSATACPSILWHRTVDLISLAK